MDEKIMTFPEWKQVMDSEDGEFFRFSDLKKMNMYRAYLGRMSDGKFNGGIVLMEIKHTKGVQPKAYTCDECGVPREFKIDFNETTLWLCKKCLTTLKEKINESV